MASSTTVNLYTSTIPSFIRGMHNLHAIIVKAEEYASTNKIPQEYFLNTRLFPDMRGLAFQVQCVTDGAKGVAVRVGRHETVQWVDDESTFEQLKTRLDKGIALLKEMKENDFVGADEKEVFLPRGVGREWKTTAQQYVALYAVPNFYFHLTTAYAILRSCGVPVGKFDYLGEVLSK